MLDLAVVALGFLNLLPGANNLTAVRAFRVLRPLRAVPRLRNLKVRAGRAVPCRAVLLLVLVLQTDGPRNLRWARQPRASSLR